MLSQALPDAYRVRNVISDLFLTICSILYLSIRPQNEDVTRVVPVSFFQPLRNSGPCAAENVEVLIVLMDIQDFHVDPWLDVIMGVIGFHTETWKCKKMAGVDM